MKTVNYFKKRKFNETQLNEAIAVSGSIRQVLIKLKLKAAGGNYRCIHTLIKRLKLDTSHFHGQGWNKGQTFGPKRPISDYLSNKYHICSSKLKERLIKDKYLKHKCQSCDGETWINKPIPLELHHKDGNRDNNNLDNLELLCPNCHTMTKTYRRIKSSL